MSIDIWGIKNCSTMKKAFDYLNAHGIAFTFHDYKKDIISTSMFETLLKIVPLESVLNKKSATWRTLSEEEQQSSQTQQGAIALMQKYPTLAKRPILKTPHSFLVGFSTNSYDDCFQSFAPHYS